jgi:hypothetical protein
MDHLLDQVCKLRHKFVEFGHTLACLARQLRTIHHFARSFFDADYSLIGFGLYILDQVFDFARCAGSTLGQPLDFFCDDGKPASGLASHSRLDRCVERQNRRAIRHFLDQPHSFANFLGHFTQPLDALRGFLRVIADAGHGRDGCADDAITFLGARSRFFGHLHRTGRLLYHQLNYPGHLSGGFGYLRGGDFYILNDSLLATEIKANTAGCLGFTHFVPD